MVTAQHQRRRYANADVSECLNLPYVGMDQPVGRSDVDCGALGIEVGCERESASASGDRARSFGQTRLERESGIQHDLCPREVRYLWNEPQHQEFVPSCGLTLQEPPVFCIIIRKHVHHKQGYVLGGSFPTV